MVCIQGHDGVSDATRYGSMWAQVSSDARTHTWPCSNSNRRAAVIATPNRRGGQLGVAAAVDHRVRRDLCRRMVEQDRLASRRYTRPNVMGTIHDLLPRLSL